MLDIAYLSEANILGASAEKQKLWEGLLSDSSMVQSFGRMLDIERMRDIIDYHSILFYTHGERV